MTWLYMKISGINLKIILDSRGEETLEAEMEGEGIKVSASVPSGKSKGGNEATSIPSQEALEKINWLKSRILKTEFASLDQFDNLLLTLDGTENKSSLGANLILVLSIAFTKLLAKKGGMEIFELIAKISGSTIHPPAGGPLCFFNLIEGGVHDPAGNGLPLQEYLYVPKTSSPRESLNQALIFIKALGDKIQGEYGKLKMGDEGGYTIPSADPMTGLEILHSLTRPGLGGQNWLGLDAAASTFFQNGKYKVEDKLMNTNELLSYYQLLTTNYPLLFLEDPFSEEDWEGFSNLQSRIGNSIWIVGDDLTVTNIKRIKMAHDKGAINAVVIKPNQIGTMTETIQATNLAKSFGFKIIVSHRSGETMDPFLADLAVGLGADGFKSGCPLQKERLVKYQRLIDIEKRLAASFLCHI